MVYLSLHQLLLDGGNAADRLNEALDPPTPVLQPDPPFERGSLDEALFLLATGRSVTLDLHAVGDLLSEADAESIVEVIKAHRLAHGFCMCRGSELHLWNRVANRQGQRLLHWPDFAAQPRAWRILGQPLRGTEPSLLDHLCRARPWSTAERAALDPQVAPQRTRFTSSTIPTIQRRLAMGRTPHGPDGQGGPDQATVSDIARRLAGMAQEGYVLRMAPHSHSYSVVRPTPPPRTPAPPAVHG